MKAMQNIYSQTNLKQGRDENDESTEGFPISFEPHRTGTYHIYLLDVIVSPKQFIGALEVLRSAGPEDEVVIHLQTPGGDVGATVMLIDAMRETEASVMVRASGLVASAGTAIMLAAQAYTIAENTEIMIHNGSTGAGGKFSDFKAQTLYGIKYMEAFMRSTYTGFLTPDELDAMLEGKDFWMDREEFIARSESRNALAVQLVEEIVKRQEAANQQEEEKEKAPVVKRSRKSKAEPA